MGLATRVHGWAGAFSVPAWWGCGSYTLLHQSASLGVDNMRGWCIIDSSTTRRRSQRIGAEVMMTLMIYNALRALGCRPALAYRLAYMETPRCVTEFDLMLTARKEVVK